MKTTILSSTLALLLPLVHGNPNPAMGGFSYPAPARNPTSVLVVPIQKPTHQSPAVVVKPTHAANTPAVVVKPTHPGPPMATHPPAIQVEDFTPPPAHLLLDKRAEGMGRWKGCDNANFTGMCQDFRDSLIECHDLPVELKDRMTSVAVVSGQYCWFFEGNKCLGTKLEVKPPGTLNLRGRRFDKCH